MEPESYDGYMLGIAAASILAVVCLYFAIEPAIVGTFELVRVLILLLSANVLAGLSLYLYRKLESLPRKTVTLNEQGFYSSEEMEKGEFVPWSSVRKIIDFQLSHEIVMQDDEGKTLLEIPHNLKGIVGIREKVFDNNLVNVPKLSDASIKQSTYFHVFCLLKIVVLLLFSVFSMVYYSAFLSISLWFLFAVCLYDYASNVYSVEIGENELTIKSIIRAKKVKFSEIDEIGLMLNNDFIQHRYQSYITLQDGLIFHIPYNKSRAIESFIQLTEKVNPSNRNITDTKVTFVNVFDFMLFNAIPVLVFLYAAWLD